VQHHTCRAKDRSQRSEFISSDRYRVINVTNYEMLSELYILRDILMHKYGREFTIDVMDNKDGCVSDRVSLLSAFPLEDRILRARIRIPIVIMAL
jgi:hypothetical protein